MTNDRYILMVGLCVLLALAPVFALAENPISNPSFEATSSVVDESVILQGTSLVELANASVVPSSVAVKDETGQTVYNHGTDYIVSGGARIGRTSASTIPDGAIVSVSYDYCTWRDWTPYSYTVTGGIPGNPVLGVCNSEGTFDVLTPDPPVAPDGVAVCGAQAWATSSNGGVCQTFQWAGGPATVSVAGRAFSQDFSFQPWDNGCRVRIGLVTFQTTDRADVAQWTTLPWSETWCTRSLTVPGFGIYTLFIEAYQPNPLSNSIISTLWDDVKWAELPPVNVTSGPEVYIPGDANRPDSTARIEWTTDVASTSRVEYGPTPGYGQAVEDSQLVTQHVVLLENLNHSSIYHCRASSQASGYFGWTSEDISLAIPIQFTKITTTPSSDGSGIIVAWNTDRPSTSRVEYGLTSAYGQSSELNSNLVTEHKVTLTGLAEDTDYHFRAWATNDPLYTPASSVDCTLHTLPHPRAALENGSFEQGHGSQAHSFYPWVQYSIAIDSSGYHPIDGLIGPLPKGSQAAWFAGLQASDGSYFVGAAANYDYKNGGVFQRVTATPDQPYTLSARYATYRKGGTSRDTRFRLGIDPNGGVNPDGADVVWRSVYSPTNDNQWHVEAVTAKAGPGGVVTVFLDFWEHWPLEWHVVAVDNACFGPPVPMSIGQLKSSSSGVGAVLTGKIVTYTDYETVLIDDKGYYKAYIEEPDGSAGIAVLLDPNRSDQPIVGNKMEVTGSVVLQNMEAMLLAYDWTVDPSTYALPRPVAVPHRSLGGATAIQPALRAGTGPCNVGLRVRVFGRVTWVDNPDPFADSTVFLDDGSGLTNGPSPGGGTPVNGVIARLRANGSLGVNVGDYIAATGVLGVRYIDPNSWPDTGDEYHTYCVSVADPNDWSVLAGASP